MIRRAVFVTTASLAAMAAAPIWAQENGDESAAEVVQEEEETELSQAAEVPGDDLFGDMFGDMFGEMFGKSEPLTAEQEARLPAAEQVVEKIFPPGTYAKMMKDTMEPMMGGIMGSAAGSKVFDLARVTGLDPSDLSDLDDAAIEEAMEIVDPAFSQKQERITSVTLEVVTDLFGEIEPSYRAGLAKAYAVRFTGTELADLAAYFATPVGSKYAAESMLIYTDPQVMSAMNELMPAMLGMLPRVMEEIGAIGEEFPASRSFSELSADEQARLAGILGTTTDQLEQAQPEELTEEEVESEA